MKELKDYLHLYKGCEIIWQHGRATLIDSDGVNCNVFKGGQKYNTSIEKIVPILRPLSDMTEDEMIEVIQCTLPDDMEDKPVVEDYGIEIFYNDDGNMVDDNVAIGCNCSCRCFDGQVAIRKCGSVHFFNDDGEPINVYNMPKIYTYLLSKHFDLFGLIESGLAIDNSYHYHPLK